MVYSLDQRMLRTATLFQAFVAVPTMLVMSGYVFVLVVFVPGHFRIYLFITAIVNALMAAGILFAVVVQRKADALISKRTTFIVEAVKSGLATAIWLWLVLDSMFGPWADYGSQHPPADRGTKIMTSLISVLVLM